MPTSNPELELADAYVRHTGTTLFLTGKAGTGKTTFLHSLKNDCPKRLIVTAPTGVAAINAGGVTLHSFFQLPFAPFIPGSTHSQSQYSFSREKINIINSLDVLVIDEISMVRADMLDAVDAVLRRFRRNTLPFGGVQLLLIGDLYQLPPVVKKDEWQLLSNSYASPYFFSSKALSETEVVTIELKKIYRQSDNRFIELLNRVRNSTLDKASLEQLNSRVVTDFSADQYDGCITLCTHNRSADQLNFEKLGQLSTTLHQFEAEVEGEFPDSTFPAAATLQLKKGAQVMFIRNDLSSEKRFYNGKIGKVVNISGTTISIRCPGEKTDIEIEPATWENIEYHLNPDTLEISESKIGAFSQFPLRLAWAITIHKSQGLTFAKAVIDAQAAFAHGQVYVALSRCRTLDGLVLSKPLSLQGLKIDNAVIQFTRKATSIPPSKTHLHSSKIRYQQRLILECFDFARLRSLLHRLISLIFGNKTVIQVSGINDLNRLQQQADDEIFKVSNNFHRQLLGLFNDSTLPTADPMVLERLSKASGYFAEKISTILMPEIDNMHLDTDNKELRRKANRTVSLLEEEVETKLAAVQCCKEGFSPENYFRAVSGAVIQVKKPKQVKSTAIYSESDIAHPQLFQTLKDWRSQKAKAEAVAHFQVLHQKTLVQIVVNLPDSLPALKKIKGIGDKLAEKYGQELIEIVGKYRKKHDIEEVILPIAAATDTKPAKPKTAKVDTKTFSIALFEKGYTPEEIAAERQLTVNTIENHLAHGIEKGRISITALLPKERIAILQEPIAAMRDKKLREIKEALSDQTSYREIHFILAHLNFLAHSGKESQCSEKN